MGYLLAFLKNDFLAAFTSSLLARRPFRNPFRFTILGFLGGILSELLFSLGALADEVHREEGVETDQGG